MKQAFLILLFLSSLLEGMAQQPNPSFQNLIDVSTTAPDAASIGKFGNIPVSYNTGASSVSIPVFEINIGKIKMPVSFDYHTGGIRVDETSSSIGLGWALDGIGILSRNVVGLPDEQGSGYLYTPPFDSLYNDWGHAGGQYGTTIDNQYAAYLYQYRLGLEDCEPDIFSYTLNGQGGKFIYRKDGSFMQMPYTNNKIAQSGTGGFKITDENGIVYFFDQPEHAQLSDYVTSPPAFTTAWHLSKIIDPNTADTVFINYAAACSFNIEHFTNYTYTFATQTQFCEPVSTGENFHTTTITHADELFIKEIIWRQGRISFVNACDRQDKASEQRLNEVDVYANQKGVLKLVKIIKPYQSYFYSNLVGYAATDERNYRLRLDSVGILPVNTGDQPLLYRMTYNTDPMASRESVAQDKWGFNNGAFSNHSLMPAQTVIYNSNNYNIGSANRDVDSLHMLACMLTSIQYPTGGRTVFGFEPHTYPSSQSYTVPHSFPVAAYGSMQTTSQTSFAADPNGSNYNIVYAFSSYLGNTQRPNITIVDQTTGQQIFSQVANIDPSQSLSNSQNPASFSPVPGHSYLVTVNIYTTTNSSITASATINWVNIYTNVPVLEKGGGLRVKDITNYDINGAFISKDTFQYDYNELLTPASYLLVNSESVNYRCSPDNEDGSVECIYNSGGGGIIYHANNIYPASQFSGSPVLYGMVTKYQVDSVGNTNGKSVYTYDIFDDQPAYASTDFSRVGVIMISNAWKNGYLTGQMDYKYNYATSGYDLIHWKINNYQAARQETVQGLKIKSTYNWLTVGGCYSLSMAAASTDYLLVQVPINTGAMLLQSSSDTTWDTNGNHLASTQTYSYNDLTHINPTGIQIRDSKKAIVTQNYKYPHDLAAAGNVYATMVNRNMISAVVQNQKLYAGVQTALTNVNYADWIGNGSLIEPQTVDQQVSLNPIETRIRFNKFDKYGNIIQEQKTTDTYQSYIWDYNSAYPIAKVLNADSAGIAYTSFESNGTGNWTVGPGTTSIAGGITGNSFYTLSAGSAISKSGLNSSARYLVTYWSKNGPLTISGTTAASGLVKRGWTYYQHSLPSGATSVSLTGAGITVDELRLYPADAQMSTFTYDPLIGQTSFCTPNNLITYYEYDGLNRLLRTRDMDSNIVKQYQYQYQHPIPYTGDTFYNAVLSHTYTAACGTGGTGSPVTYTIAARTYSSIISQTDADAKAQADMTANGQNYANAHGACTYYNTIQQQTFQKTCSCLYTGSSVIYSVPANTYTSSTSQADANQKALNDISTNGQNYANANGACTTTCINQGQKIINCACQLGTQVCTSSVLNSSTHLYTITYHYTWTDGTSSQNYTMTSSAPCANQP